MGDGRGSFEAARPIPIPELLLSRRVTAADVDGDDAVDILVPDELAGSVWILSNQGDGTFAPPVSFPTDGTEPVAVGTGDLNGDGEVDVVTANGYPAYDASVLLGDGGGAFGAPTLVGVGFAPHSIVIADLNGDGVQDLATGNVGDSTVSILLGNGDGSFLPADAVSVGSADGNNTIGVADVNADGLLDFVTANYKPSSLITVLLQIS
jgi:hypothetical protein